MQIAHHLATVAHTQRKGIAAIKEGRKFIACTRVEQDGFCPAFARTQHVAVREAPTSRNTLEVSKTDTSGNDVTHVHVNRGEAGTVKSRGHFELPVNTLLAQNRHFGSRSQDRR